MLDRRANTYGYLSATRDGRRRISDRQPRHHGCATDSRAHASAGNGCTDPAADRQPTAGNACVICSADNTGRHE